MAMADRIRIKKPLSMEVPTPWGSWRVLHETERCKVKQLVVNPGARLSYQTHRYRKESWVVVTGKATVILLGAPYHLKTGDSIQIPIGVPHRVSNQSTSDPLVLIEVQTGTYFGEDDIVRLEDDYGRIPTD